MLFLISKSFTLYFWHRRQFLENYAGVKLNFIEESTHNPRKYPRQIYKSFHSLFLLQNLSSIFFENETIFKVEIISQPPRQ